jgi:hypothetical protein
MYQWDITELQTQTGAWTQAFIYEGLTPRGLKQFQSEWHPALIRMGEADAHWDWRAYWETYGETPGHTFFQLECEGSL